MSHVANFTSYIAQDGKFAELETALWVDYYAALRQQNGFHSSQLLVDRASNRIAVFTVWANVHAREAWLLSDEWLSCSQYLTRLVLGGVSELDYSLDVAVQAYPNLSAAARA